ncbi:unnamed protein product [Ilex paraguariensis]|uniref:Uncharacterized protein n=1 Tax=Ilex paraguariensis TaxID=185542 RepID=A0ABC8RWC1_9AQUA
MRGQENGYTPLVKSQMTQVLSSPSDTPLGSYEDQGLGVADRTLWRIVREQHASQVKFLACESFLVMGVMCTLAMSMTLRHPRVTHLSGEAPPRLEIPSASSDDSPRGRPHCKTTKFDFKGRDNGLRQACLLIKIK